MCGQYTQREDYTDLFLYVCLRRVAPCAIHPSEDLNSYSCFSWSFRACGNLTNPFQSRFKQKIRWDARNIIPVLRPSKSCLFFFFLGGGGGEGGYGIVEKCFRKQNCVFCNRSLRELCGITTYYRQIYWVGTDENRTKTQREQQQQQQRQQQYTRTHTHERACARTHARTHADTHTSTHTDTCTHTDTRIHTRAQTHTHTYKIKHDQTQTH